MTFFSFVVGCGLAVAAHALKQYDVWHFDVPEAAANVSAVSNAFDSAQLLVIADSTDGQRVRGFVYQRFQRTFVPGHGENLTAVDAPHIALRFVGKRVGQLCMNFSVAVGGAVVFVSPVPAACVTVAPSHAKGFVRVAPNRQHFAHEATGEAFVPVGENMCWSVGGNLTFDFDKWVSRLAARGGSYMRLWLNPPGLSPFALETVATTVGRYDLAAAWRLDYVLQLAQKSALKAMLCTQSFNCFHAVQPFPAWAENPYNAANGGPLPSGSPFLFFTDPTAAALYKRSIDYLVARFSAFESVFAFELFNEVDLVDQFDANVVAAWHQQMLRHLQANDPNDHMRTTSFAFPPGFGNTWQLPELSFTQTHTYNAADMAAAFALFAPAKQAAYGKPTWVGEFGTSNDGTVEHEEDPTGIALFNGMWAGLVTSAGSGALWWWDDYVDEFDLYGRFVGVAAVAQTLSPFVATYNWSFGEATTQAVRVLASSGSALNSSDPPLLMGVAQNKQFTWFAANHSVVCSPVGSQPPIVISLPSAVSGTYAVAWFNTTTGQRAPAIKTVPIKIAAGQARIAIPATLTTSLFLLAARTKKKKPTVIDYFSRPGVAFHCLCCLLLTCLWLCAASCRVARC